MLPIVNAMRPTTYQVAAALMACGGRFITFKYTTQLPHRADRAAALDTKYVGAWDEVKAFMDQETASIWFAKSTLHWVITLHVMGRRKRLPTGTGRYARYGYKQGEYLPRTYRLDGIQIQTLKVSDGPHGLEELTPKARRKYAVEEGVIVGDPDLWEDGQ